MFFSIDADEYFKHRYYCKTETVVYELVSDIEIKPLNGQDCYCKNKTMFYQQVSNFIRFRIEITSLNEQVKTKQYF